jgi:hypothetical protein
LFQGIARHRVAWVQEAERQDNLKRAVPATIIKEIVW